VKNYGLRATNSLILFGARKNCLSSGRSRLLHQFTRRVTNLTVVIMGGCYGCENLSLTLREVYRLSVFDKRVLMIIFGLKRDERYKAGENCTRRSFILELFTKYNYNDQVQEDKVGMEYSTHRRGVIHIGFWWERDH
jgi:hypothetical protein